MESNNKRIILNELCVRDQNKRRAWNKRSSAQQTDDAKDDAVN